MGGDRGAKTPMRAATAITDAAVHESLELFQTHDHFLLPGPQRLGRVSSFFAAPGNYYAPPRKQPTSIDTYLVAKQRGSLKAAQNFRHAIVDTVFREAGDQRG